MKPQGRVSTSVGLAGVLACALVALGSAPSSAQVGSSSIPLTVSATPKVLQEEGRIKVVVFVPADDANRMMRIIIDSADFYASSDIPLQGHASAVHFERHWRDLPPGYYDVRAIVLRADGTELEAKDAFVVFQS